MRRGGDTMTYLLVPLFEGVISKLDSWSGMSLSYAGRLGLIKFIVMGH